MIQDKAVFTSDRPSLLGSSWSESHHCGIIPQCLGNRELLIRKPQKRWEALGKCLCIQDRKLFA